MLHAATLIQELPARWRHPHTGTKSIDETLTARETETARLWRHIMQLESEVLKLRQDLERERHKANIDALTGIANRRAYRQRLSLERARARREQKPLSLVVWDIDHFKTINDRFGHQVGDQVLVCIAQKINRRLRGTDFVARIGGEEFVSLLADCDGDNARRLAAQLCRDIAADCLPTEPGPVRVTLSCGIAEVRAQESESELFARADSALYRAKREGRNRVCVADTQGSPE